MTDVALEHLDLNLLHVFDALRTQGSVSGAAQRMRMTQSGASRALGRLRDALGDSLFLPANSGLLLTPYAEHLVDYVRGALDLLSAGIARAEFDPARSSRVFAIAMSDYSEAVLLPSLYRRLAAEAPGIRIDVVAHSRDTSRSLGEGTPDLSIDTAGLDGPRIHARRLLHDELVAVARADHPAFTQAGAAPRACGELAQVVVLPCGLSRQADGHAELHGEPRAEPVQPRSLLASILLATQADRIAALPRLLASQIERSAGLRVLPGASGLGSIELRMHWHERTHADPGHRWLRNLVREVASAVELTAGERP